MRPALSLVFLLSAVAAACLPEEPGPAPRPAETVAVARPEVPYRFTEPDAAFAFPGALREVSGLTVLDDGHLGAVQDEDGILFVLDREEARVRAEHRFRGNGDYEGVERVGDVVWVLRSDGTLYEVHDPTGEAPRSGKVDMPLRPGCDAEGLAHDDARNRLLIVCKESPGPGLEGVRAVYAFDLESRRLAETPVLLLDRQALDRGNDLFKPSALAVHPGTGRIYVISSARKALAVVEPDGVLYMVIDLPDRLFTQPEGLAFFPDGTLFIANEGQRGAATLLRFTQHTP